MRIYIWGNKHWLNADKTSPAETFQTIKKHKNLDLFILTEKTTAEEMIQHIDKDILSDILTEAFNAH